MEKRITRTRVVWILLAGSVLPVLVGKFLLPELVWWLFGASCVMVAVGTALLMSGPADPVG